MSLIAGIYAKNMYWQLPLEDDGSVSIGASKKDTLRIPDFGLNDANLVFTSKKGAHTLSAKGNVYKGGIEVHDAPVSEGDVLTCGTSSAISIYICPRQEDYPQSVNLAANKEFLIGRSRDCSFVLSNKSVGSRHAKITFESGKYKLIDLDSKNHTFVNGKQVSTHYLNDGDIVSIAYYSIVFDNGELSFLNTGNDLKINLDDKDIVHRYPLFRRSPRLGNESDYKTIEIQAPPYIGEKPSVNWLAVFLPPLVMIGVSVASMLLSNGGLMTLLFIVPMSIVTLLTTIISYFAQVRKFRAQQKQKLRSYDEYIKEVSEEIETAYNRQLSITNSANPETAYCYDIASNRMRRLWERSLSDEDFLNVRMGKGTLPLTTDIIFPQTPVGEQVSPQLITMKAIADRFRMVQNISVTLPITSARTIGVVGNRQVAVKAVHNSIVQLTTHHSYADVSLVVISSEKDADQWKWLRWLPHTWDFERRLRYVASDKKQSSELLGYFEDVLKKRIAATESDRFNGGVILPYILFVITDYTLVENREFLSLLTGAGSGVRASALLLFDSMNKLPKECDKIVEFSNSGGALYSKANSSTKTPFTLDQFDEYEKFARAMAPVRDKSVVQKSLLPSSVSFYQGFGIKSADELNVVHNWKTSNSYKSLAVPIGTKENGKPFLFDLHEKAHGPHGLVAGTTGSGKSEVLQTWILSMCAHFSPQDISFVLIDFKGMGLAGTLQGLPHIAGVISNVDENIQRNLFSLESELARRQKLFASVSSDTMKIGDIYDYQEAYRFGKLTEPLSHLIIVVDEFAELKSKFPDFMSALDSAARVGRSLGVHLVLATQKPDGVVTEEVRANSKFKWCLKVASEGDSKAVIGRPEAVSIVNPGRAYIQVGNNEVFELVQTYYSGASIDNAEASDTSPEVSFVDSLGRRETIRSGHMGNAKLESEKELIALVRHIANSHTASGLPNARKVWTNALPSRLCLSDIPTSGHPSSLYAVVGLVDDPRHQRQLPCAIDFASDGHVIIYGAPGTGKTVLLQTMIMSLSERYTPNEVNIYVMDFGSWSMKNLQGLPHIGGVANGNEDEKLINLMKLIAESLEERKSLFANFGASNLDAYRQASGKVMPSIIIIVDNFAPIREMYPDIENTFVRLSREGSSYGIYIVATATSLSGSISYHLSQNFKQAISLRMTEKADYREIVGDTEGLEPSKIAGRGLVRGKPPMEFQTALAVNAQDDVDYVSSIKLRCGQLAALWDGELPREIPVMPDVVIMSHIRGIPSGTIAIGLSYENISPVVIDGDSRLIIISGTDGSGKTNLLRAISQQLPNKAGLVHIHAEDDGASEQIVEAISKAAEGEPVTLLIDNIPKWLSHAQYETVDALERLISDIKNNDFVLVATGDASEITQSGYGIISKIISSGVSVLLGGSFSDHSSAFEAINLGYSQQSEQLPSHSGYLIQKRRATVFKAVYAGGGEDGI